MRILHIVHQYPPDYIGGTELYTQSLASRQSRAGHQVAVLCPVAMDDKWPEPNLEGGVRVFRVPSGVRSRGQIFMTSFGHRELHQAFEQVLQVEKPDLVHVQHLMGLPVGLVDTLNEAQIPYLVTLHDYWYKCGNAQLLTNYDRTICDGPRWWLNCARCALARSGHPRALILAPAIAPIMAWRDRVVGKVLNSARVVISPTEFVRRTYTNLGTAADKIKVVPHGIDLPQKLPQGSRLNHGPLRIVYVGGISRQKGVHVLVEAVSQIPHGLVELTIYGDHTRYEDYTESLQKLATGTGINFGGRLARDQLWSVLVDNDVLAVPSIWFENAALVVQEAFAAKLPVLASDQGALRERVAHGRDGLLIEPGNVEAWRDNIRALAQDRGLLADLKSGISPVKSVAEHAQEIESTYRLALSVSP